MGMGTCGGAPSSFLCVAHRGADHGRRDYRTRRRVETSPSGRGVHLCVILMLFQRYDTPEFSGFICRLAQESAAFAVNAAIRTLPASVQRRRRANPVVDGQLVPKKRAPRKRRREEEANCSICFDPTTVTLVCGHAMCEECMGRLAVFQGQTLTRSRRRVVIQCPLRCLAPTERVLA